MKSALLLITLSLFVAICNAQATSQLDECESVVTKAANPSIPPSICSVAVSLITRDEHVASVTIEGVLTLRDGILKDHAWPPKLGSTLLLADSKRLFKDVEQEGKVYSDEAAMLPSLKTAWEEMRGAYCDFHPGDAYSDLADQQQVCPDVDGRAASSFPSTSSSARPTHFSVVSSASGTKMCQKAITFAVAQSGGLDYRLPNVSTKWLDKAQKKYPNVCFLQYGARSGQENYLIVLSSSNSAFGGLQPVFHRSTTITPVSGSGTVTDNAGGIRDFTYQGTVTTTTTMQSNVPYTDTTADFYANAYTEDGSLVGTSERSSSSRQGGDPSNALGYNLMSGLLSIHLKEHLLDSIVKKVSTLP